MEYSKSIKKRMRELNATAYERELRREISKLAENFKLWEADKLDTFDLEEHIHKFHNGASRKLYVRYNDRHPDMAVAYALETGLITEEECPPEIIDNMRAIGKILRGE